MYYTLNIVINNKIYIDSRKVQPDSTFIAIIGENLDGHNFISDAIKAKANKIYYNNDKFNFIKNEIKKNPEIEFIGVKNTTLELLSLAKKYLKNLRIQNSNLKVIAITGSVGKTTTKDILGSSLKIIHNKRPNSVVFPVESFNNEIGVPLTIFNADRETDYLVLELGTDEPGQIADLVDVSEPDNVVILKIGVAHFGGFESKTEIINEKLSILNKKPKNAVIFGDDERYSEIIDVASKISQVTNIIKVSKREVEIIQSSDGKLRFIYKGAKFETNFYGVHHIYNILSAIKIIELLNICDLNTISEIFAKIHPIAKHRMEVFRISQRAVIIDDSFNANPDSMKAALDYLKFQKDLLNKELGNEVKAIAILSDMLQLGKIAQKSHREVSEYALNKCGIDKIIVTGEYKNYYLLNDESMNEKIELVTNLENHKFETENVVYLLKASSACKLWNILPEIKKQILDVSNFITKEQNDITNN